jgi:hypothetical protein
MMHSFRRISDFFAIHRALLFAVVSDCPEIDSGASSL